MKKRSLDIVLIDTGETKDIEKATPMEISSFLTDINRRAKTLKKTEEKIKDYVKGKVDSKDYNEDGVAMFGEHKLKKYYQFRFDKKRFDKEATDEEKRVLFEAEQIEEKYKTGQEVTKIT
jgi:hypothetical protein